MEVMDQINARWGIMAARVCLQDRSCLTLSGPVKQDQFQAVVQAGTQMAGAGGIAAIHGFSGSWR